MTQLSYWVRGLICLGLLVSSRTGWSEESLRIRILCYNIHHAEGVDRKLDLNRIGKLIKTVNPDVVALQEVDQNVRRTRNVNQPKVLSEITGLDVVFGKNIPLQDGHYGNVLLSRFEIQHYKNHQLPNFEQGEQRGVIEATLKLPGGWGALCFMATHLDHRGDEKERLASATAIRKIAQARMDQPTILAGDLNATPDSATLMRFFETWTSANQDPRPTVPVTQPERQIDYILFRPQARWRVVEVKVLEEAVASDHRAIFADLELGPSGND